MGALDGRVALVTGSSRGIGRAVALRFAQEGCRVVLNCRRSLEAAREVASQIEATRPGASLVAAGDVSSREEVEGIVAAALRSFGGLDILVNNAGTAGRGLGFLDIRDDDWRTMIETTLTGAFLCARAVIPHMLKGRWGRIVNIASTSGITGGTSGAHYAAAKGGLISMTKALSAEIAPRGITVNCIAPSKIETEMLWQSLGPGEKERLLAKIPVGRFGTPQDIAALALFLASEAAGYITGETVVASGGYR
jgi:3-oxoacyl-[acyl-carrier protein] reductase